MKLRIGLEVYLPMCGYRAMTSNHLSFASVEMDKNYSLILPRWKGLCHRWSRDQWQPGSFSQRPREAEEREPGNKVGVLSVER